MPDICPHCGGDTNLPPDQYRIYALVVSSSVVRYIGYTRMYPLEKRLVVHRSGDAKKVRALCKDEDVSIICLEEVGPSLDAAREREVWWYEHYAGRKDADLINRHPLTPGAC